MRESSVGDGGLVTVHHVQRLQLRQVSEGRVRDGGLVAVHHVERLQLRQVREGRVGELGATCHLQ